MAEPRSGRRTKETIGHVAITLFAERGVDATSIRDIAVAAGITEPAIYRHFENKATLVRELFTTHYLALSDVLDEVQAGKADTRAKLGAMIDTFCRLFDEQPALFRFLLIAQHRHSPILPETQPTPLDRVRSVLIEGMRLGVLPERDAYFATALVFGIVLQTATFKVFGRLDAPMSAYAGDLAAAAWAALVAQPALLPKS